MKKIAVGDLGEFWYGDYKEPFEQLEGGVSGHPVGVLLKADDGRLLCAWCGKTYENLGSHVAHTHGQTAREYKSEVGLLTKSALVSDRLRMVHSRDATKHGFGVRPHDQHRFIARKGTMRAVGVRHGSAKPEHRNKTGTCYAQALQVGRTVLNETGRLSEKQLRKHGIFETTVRRYFGDMDGFRQAIGLEPIRFRRHSLAELTTVLRNLANELGRTPTGSDLNRYGLPARKTYSKRFGSWPDACRKAGLDPRLPLPDSEDTDSLILTTYATVGTISKTARHLHLDRKRVESVFAKYGAPFTEHFARGGTGTETRKAWAADMARRLAGMAA